VIALREALDAELFGGKAVQLGAAIRAELPVPRGCALSWRQVEEIVADRSQARERLAGSLGALRPPLAVRSSGVGEDAAGSSFAGQHRTKLGVFTMEELVDAVFAVHASALAPSALAYRQRLGITGSPRIAVVIQELVDAECAGVLFTKNPLTGSDERVIEASWGLGESVVAGLVTPDRYRLARDGRLLERSAGEKDLAFRVVPGGVQEHPVDPALVSLLCLDDGRLGALNALARRCERVFGDELDLEWAIEGQSVHLLQQRPITRLPSA
jgi:pyruvate,water dikinase